ncbi:GNAT family N-acetyltransferase [Krasilnikovia sp. MM14-A1259]|uniref:GNAT family N-acetyltransferase n=1 Tax=Krasilnikovia sp. MM14-A1259 TaxID=3373539 RepID=UPI0037FD4F2F
MAKILPTAVPGLQLRELHREDAAGYHELVQRNVAHLTKLGDYQEEVAAGAEEFAELFAEPVTAPVRFGVFLDGELVGRVDLVPVDPPKYGLGYWLSEDATGRGLATSAVAALLDYAGTELHGTDVFAGVTHGNVRSDALLERLGFEVVATFDNYRRFHRTLPRD